MEMDMDMEMEKEKEKGKAECSCTKRTTGTTTVMSQGADLRWCLVITLCCVQAWDEKELVIVCMSSRDRSHRGHDPRGSTCRYTALAIPTKVVRQLLCQHGIQRGL